MRFNYACGCAGAMVTSFDVSSARGTVPSRVGVREFEGYGDALDTSQKLCPTVYSVTVTA